MLEKIKAPMKRFLYILGVLLLSTPLYSQLDDDEFYYGFKSGATYSSIDEIQTTLISPVFPTTTYTTENAYRFGFTAGFYVYHRFRNSKLAIQPEISFAMEGGDFNYSDIEELEYTISFIYNYINIAPLLKLYGPGGLHLTIGPQLGININGTGIDYTSNKPDLGPDLQIQQHLRGVLKGQANVSAVFGVGYEFPFGLMLEGRYQQGFTDVIETQANGFNFIENKNVARSFQFTVGYAIPFYQ